MRKRQLPNRTCQNIACTMYHKKNTGHILRNGRFSLKNGSKRRRFICKACGHECCTTTGTAYHRKRCSKDVFDEVAGLSVEGVNISSIARVKHCSWDTVCGWLETAREFCSRFNNQLLIDYELKEVQADELSTFVDCTKQKVWLMTLLESSTRLWVNFGIGGRTYKNLKLLFAVAFHRGLSDGRVLITTDGFCVYERILKRMLGPACFYGQVIKKWKKNRVTRVEQRVIIGEDWQIREALARSEDSEVLNTSFIERLNLTLRQGSSYLARKGGYHAGWIESLVGHMELLQCHYNFIRPHLSLKFGTEYHTPAMEAGIAKRKFSFRKIFEGAATGYFLLIILPMAEYDEIGSRRAA